MTTIYNNISPAMLYGIPVQVAITMYIVPRPYSIRASAWLVLWDLFTPINPDLVQGTFQMLCYWTVLELVYQILTRTLIQD